MLVTTLGLVCLALGVAGVRYAPAIVAAQHQQGMAPLEDGERGDELEGEDRIRVTKGVGVLLALVGVVLLGYGVV
ncbi:hypothetical protein [Natronolimnohabitans innermongolicus]|uniref:Uncharacterized protein n=1 Tax=Natronolimnohabitans innermongolicus JCM 12255 TaxID=1227499 RepID=L9XE44_9EURY|nr:hypothetical protein [Natronolimnohabitans innermongolicus]ELY59985.1 hypothetical protein C493_04418 [Natronolimnohabitans innermongolicus JCM 12255]